MSNSGCAGCGPVSLLRLPLRKSLKIDPLQPTGLALSRTLRAPLPAIGTLKRGASRGGVAVGAHGRVLATSEQRSVQIAGFPNAVIVGDTVFLNGLTQVDATHVVDRGALSFAGANAGRRTPNLMSIPSVVAAQAPPNAPDLDFAKARDELEDAFVRAAQAWTAKGNVSLSQTLADAAKLSKVVLPHLWPGALVEEALSPIGVAHYLRQLYFNKEEGVGPIEEAFTVAPLETLEVVYETVRKQIHEEILEQGLESVSESAIEQKNLDEVSDKVSSMVQQDTSASMSANASGGGSACGRWARRASADFSISSQRSREEATRRLKEVTKRASERITKSFSLKTRDVTETTSTNMTRRVIRNESNAAGQLRAAARAAPRQVKVQDLGSGLVWQLYLRNPGEGIAVSRFVHFRESAPIAVPEVRPACRRGPPEASRARR